MVCTGIFWCLEMANGAVAWSTPISSGGRAGSVGDRLRRGRGEQGSDWCRRGAGRGDRQLGRFGHRGSGPERSGQIANGRTPPIRDVRRLHPESGLEESQLRGVVEGVGTHVAPRREGRDHQDRYPETETQRAGDRLPCRAGSGSTVRYSPGVPGGRGGGATWSKKPSFSSYMMNSTVLDHVFGFDSRALITCWVNHSPRPAATGGCSSYSWGNDPRHLGKGVVGHIGGEVVGANAPGQPASHVRPVVVEGVLVERTRSESLYWSKYSSMFLLKK